MRTKSLPLIALSLIVVAGAFGAKKLGTISASGSFGLRGAAVPASAARSLPLLDGDVVETGSSTAIILLNDASRVAVDQDSWLKVKAVDEETVFCFEKGTLQFSSAENSQLALCAQSRRMKLHEASEGTVSINDQGQVVVSSENGSVLLIEEKKCPCKSSKMPVVLVGAAGAAAAVVGTATTGGDDPPLPVLSPTQQ